MWTGIDRSNPHEAVRAIHAATGWSTSVRDDKTLGHTLFVSNPLDGHLLAVATIYPGGKFSVGGTWGSRVKRALLDYGWVPVSL
jgi:hypothetical protein